MSMELALKAFCKDVCGAVTVDWVVLTAAIIGMGMLILIPIGFSADSSAQNIGDSISDLNVGYGN
jgi:hypothetical protein